jgi:hypothetical protein
MIQSQVRLRCRQHRRHGAALVATLVCLVIVMAILGNMLVGALRTGRQMRVERDRRQCELLLQAGLDRVARRTPEATYTGEVLDVPAAQIGGSGDGQITIRISHPEAAQPHIHVLAEYPVGSESSIRRSRTVRLQSTTPSSQE